MHCSPDVGQGAAESDTFRKNSTAVRRPRQGLPPGSTVGVEHPRHHRRHRPHARRTQGRRLRRRFRASASRHDYRLSVGRLVQPLPLQCGQRQGTRPRHMDLRRKLLPERLCRRTRTRRNARIVQSGTGTGFRKGKCAPRRHLGLLHVSEKRRRPLYRHKRQHCRLQRCAGRVLSL